MSDKSPKSAIELINQRVNQLDSLIKEHAGTKHEYPLLAGKFELLRLARQLMMMANK